MPRLQPDTIPASGKVVAVIMPPELYERLTREAQSLYLSRGALVRQIVAKRYAEEQKS